MRRGGVLVGFAERGVLVERQRKRRPQVQVEFGSLENCRRLRGCSCVEGANEASERRLRIKSSVCEEQSGSRGVLGVTSKREMKAS